jgi:hypothetical protein
MQGLGFRQLHDRMQENQERSEANIADALNVYFGIFLDVSRSDIKSIAYCMIPRLATGRL